MLDSYRKMSEIQQNVKEKQPLTEKQLAARKENAKKAGHKKLERKAELPYVEPVEPVPEVIETSPTPLPALSD